MGRSVLDPRSIQLVPHLYLHCPLFPIAYVVGPVGTVKTHKNQLPICVCGDWQHEHEQMAGPCLLGEHCTPGYCKKYRFSRLEEATAYHLAEYEWRLRAALEAAIEETP